MIAEMRVRIPLALKNKWRALFFSFVIYILRLIVFMLDILVMLCITILFGQYHHTLFIIFEKVLYLYFKVSKSPSKKVTLEDFYFPKDAMVYHTLKHFLLIILEITLLYKRFVNKDLETILMLLQLYLLAFLYVAMQLAIIY